MNAGKNNSIYVPQFSRVCKRDNYSIHNGDFAYLVQECKKFLSNGYKEVLVL